MDARVVGYINTETELARFKLKVLERKSSITDKLKLIIDTEREFLSVDFKSLNFKSIDETADAMKLFRESRVKFYNKFKLSATDSSAYDADSLGLIRKRLNNYAVKLMTDRVIEVNVVQNSIIFTDLVKAATKKNGRSFEANYDILSRYPSSRLSKLEIPTISKKRARLQNGLYSLGRFLLNLSNDESVTLNELKEMVLQDFYELFKYYNSSLHLTKSVVSGTSGENVQLSRLKPLTNALDYSFEDISRASVIRAIGAHSHYSLCKPRIMELFDINNTVPLGRCYGVLMPILRTGNERVTLMYKSIFVGGNDVSSLFLPYLSNVKADYNGDIRYFKSHLIKGHKELTLPERKLLMSSLLKTIDIDNSEIMIPETRSEDIALADIRNILDIRIQDAMDIISGTY